MTATAQAMGMTRTTFRNAHGLTEAGHMSTARDMTVLGRHLIYDYPQYYNIFGRITTDAGVQEVANTNRRFLQAYRGSDGIKTGYTHAAGFNLVASAERGQERIIATMFGGATAAARDARVAELLDMGFARAPDTARIDRPRPVGPQSNGLVVRSLRPQARPVPDTPEVAEDLLAVNADAVQNAVVANVLETARCRRARGNPSPACATRRCGLDRCATSQPNAKRT